MRGFLGLTAWLFGISMTAAACSGADPLPPTCNVAYSCGADQTCSTQDGVHFGCVAAGTGVLGASCDPSVRADAVCGPGLLCLGVGSPPVGTCTGWCDRTHPCPSDQACVLLLTSNDVEVQVCSLSSSSSCAFDYSCPAGQTCWTKNGTSFECMPSGTLALRALCDGTGTTPTCGDGAVCFAGVGSSSSTCTPWCAADLSCPTGLTCGTYGTVYGITARVCQ